MLNYLIQYKLHLILYFKYWTYLYLISYSLFLPPNFFTPFTDMIQVG